VTRLEGRELSVKGESLDDSNEAPHEVFPKCRSHVLRRWQETLQHPLLSPPRNRRVSPLKLRHSNSQSAVAPLSAPTESWMP
jgi:hypothetical protein